MGLPKRLGFASGKGNALDRGVTLQQSGMSLTTSSSSELSSEFSREQRAIISHTPNCISLSSQIFWSRLTMG
jgi:hypothetical protein